MITQTTCEIRCNRCGGTFSASKKHGGKWATLCNKCRQPQRKSKQKIEPVILDKATKNMCDLIEKHLNKYPPRIRPLMKKQLEMYRLGEYEADTVHFAE